MLSSHELVVAVREIWPEVQEIESKCLKLFNLQFQPGRGPTGVTGENELKWTIQYLRGSANFLERIGVEHGLLKAVPA
jgi:hypothetical protein